MKKHYDVLIATPGRDLDAGYVKSLMETVEKLNELGISYKWLNDVLPIVHLAREFTLDAGYLLVDGSNYVDYNCKGPIRDTVTYNKIFLIDSDIGWTVDDFLKLYYSDLDIVAGIYLRADLVPAFKPKDSDRYTNKDITYSTEIIEADYVGMGFVCVKSGVFEKLERPWFKLLTDKITSTNTEGSVNVEIHLGEDVSWCRRVKGLGYIVHADLGVKLTHYKVIPIG